MRANGAAGLDALFAPRSVAVIGASMTTGKLGAAMTHSLAGFPGPVLRINARHPDPAAGIFPSVAEAAAATGVPADLAVFCVPAAATAAALARSALDRLDPPLAVKMLEPVVAHKRRAGGVRLGIWNDDAMTQALDALDGAGARRYLVEEMAPPGFDLIVGARRDPVYGPVVLLGLGGDAAEALDAVSVRLAPLSERVAATMVDDLPGSDRPDGWAGSLDRRALSGVIAALGGLLAATDDLAEIEVNPLRAVPDGRLVALDVLAVARERETMALEGDEPEPVLDEVAGGS